MHGQVRRAYVPLWAGADPWGSTWVVAGSCDGLRRVVGFQCPEDAELVAFGVSHDDPRHGVGLADIDPTGTESLCSRDLQRLIIRTQVNVEPVLDPLSLWNPGKQHVGRHTILRRAFRRFEHNLIGFLERDTPAE